MCVLHNYAVSYFCEEPWLISEMAVPQAAT